MASPSSFLSLKKIDQGELIMASDWNTLIDRLDAIIKKIMVTEKLVATKVINPTIVYNNNTSTHWPKTATITYPLGVTASSYDFVVPAGIYLKTTSSETYSSISANDFAIKILKPSSAQTLSSDECYRLFGITKPNGGLGHEPVNWSQVALAELYGSRRWTYTWSATQLVINFSMGSSEVSLDDATIRITDVSPLMLNFYKYTTISI